MIAGLNTQRHTRPWALRENVQNLNYRYLDIYVASRYLYIFLHLVHIVSAICNNIWQTPKAHTAHSRSVDIYV